MEDFQTLLSKHMKKILKLWLQVKEISISEYEDHVHSLNAEVNYLVKEKLEDALLRYQTFIKFNPDVKISDFLDIIYGIDTFASRWEKQIK